MRTGSYMRQAFEWVHFLTWLALGALFVVLAIRAWTLLKRVDVLVGHADTAVQSMNATLEAVNRPCGTGKPCGTLAELNKTSLAARSTLTHLDMAVAHEDSELAVLDSQERQMFTDAHQTLQNAQETTRQATSTLRTMNNTIADIQPVLAHSDAIVHGYENMLPEMHATLVSVQGTSANLNAATLDFRTKFHSLLYPPPCKTKWCKLKRAWPYVRAAAGMTDPLYWSIQIYKGATP